MFIMTYFSESGFWLTLCGISCFKHLPGLLHRHTVRLEVSFTWGSAEEASEPTRLLQGSCIYRLLDRGWLFFTDIGQRSHSLAFPLCLSNSASQFINLAGRKLASHTQATGNLIMVLLSHYLPINLLVASMAKKKKLPHMHTRRKDCSMAWMPGNMSNDDIAGAPSEVVKYRLDWLRE